MHNTYKITSTCQQRFRSGTFFVTDLNAPHTHTHTNYPNLPTMIYTWNSLCYRFKCTTHKQKLQASVNKGLDLQHSMIYCNLASVITFVHQTEKMHCKLQSSTCHYLSTQDSEIALPSSTCYNSTSTTQNNGLIYKPNLCKLVFCLSQFYHS